MKTFNSRMKTALVMLVVGGSLLAGAVQAVSFSNPASGCRFSPQCHFGATSTRACCYPP